MSKSIRYLYDDEGVMGFIYEDSGASGVNIVKNYYYIKDAMGNVVSIVSQEHGEEAWYQYDAWGKCTVNNLSTSNNTKNIGTLNPIRWKSQYQDEESGLYVIHAASGTRYYSPETKQFLSPAPPESMMANAATIYGLNPYLLTLTNPVNMAYNGYTIATNAVLSYDPEKLTAWQSFWRGVNRFFNTPLGKVVAVHLFLTALALSIITNTWPMFLFSMGMTGGMLLIGAASAGSQSKNQGNDFWAGFAGYINGNWAQSVAISMALFIVSLGVSAVMQAVANATRKAALANAVKMEQTLASAADDYLDYLYATLPDEQLSRLEVAAAASADGKTFGYGINFKARAAGSAELSNLSATVRKSCAEAQAISQALAKGAKMRNLHVYAIKANGMAAWPCGWCVNAFNGNVAMLYNMRAI